MGFVFPPLKVAVMHNKVQQPGFAFLCFHVVSVLLVNEVRARWAYKLPVMHLLYISLLTIYLYHV